ncbi:MAG TPA: hypothetical protein VFB21_19080 [Chthonomonadaceae bacterium]|nr:hypothetical protein [Chthonomonadaceae bacterium]
MASANWTKSGRTLPMNALWLGAGVLATLLLGFIQSQKPTHRPAPAATRQTAAAAPSAKKTLSAATMIVAQNSGGTAAPTIEPETGTPERRPLSFYTGEVRGDLFSAPQPPTPPKPKPAPAKPAPPPVVVPVAPVNPFADWAYTGTVTMDDTKMALLENTKTKEGRYVKVGEDFIGAKVGDITDQMVTLQSAGKPWQLAKSDNITVTPLDKSAAFLTAAPAGQPGQPGPQPGQPGQPQTGVNGNNTFILPNGRVLNGRQWRRRNRNLDNNFDRGSRGGGFGGGWGGF